MRPHVPQPAMKTYTLVNDTTLDRHIGCDAVIQAIRDAARLRGYREVATQAVSAEIGSADYERLLDKSSLVVINGEGTLHDDSRGCKNIAHFAAVACRAGKRVALINSSYSDNSIVTSELFSGCEFLAFRESTSARAFQAHCPQAAPQVVGDLSLLAFSRAVRPGVPSGIVVTDSVLPEATHELLDIGMRLNARYACVKDYNYGTFSRRNRPVRMAMRLFGRHLKQLRPRPKLLLDTMRHRRSGFTNDVQNAAAVITGRFHVVMYCLRNELPFFYVASNTDKIDAVLRDVGLDIPRRKIERWADLSTRGRDAEELATAATYSTDELKSLRAYLERHAAASADLFDAVFC